MYTKHEYIVHKKSTQNVEVGKKKSIRENTRTTV